MEKKKVEKEEGKKRGEEEISNYLVPTQIEKKNSVQNITSTTKLSLRFGEQWRIGTAWEHQQGKNVLNNAIIGRQTLQLGTFLHECICGLWGGNVWKELSTGH